MTKMIIIGIDENNGNVCDSDNPAFSTREIVHPQTVDRPGVDMWDMSRPRVVARQTIKDISGSKSIMESIKTDYMGAAEFEYHSPLESRIRMAFYLLHNAYSVNGIESIKEASTGKVLYIFHHFTDNDLAKYIEHLQNYIDGKYRFKEFVDLDAIVKGVSARNGKFDCWWDLRNDCYFSFNKEAMVKMPQMAEHTYKRMREK